MNKPKMGKIKLKNDSVIYVSTDEGEYQHVEGKFYNPPLITDESLLQDIDSTKFALREARKQIRKGNYQKALTAIKLALITVDTFIISLKIRNMENDLK